MKTKKNKYNSRKRKPRSKSIKRKRIKNKHKKGGNIRDKRDIFIEKVAKQNNVSSNSPIVPYGYTRQHLSEAFDRELSEVGIDDLDVLVKKITEKMSNESEVHHKRLNNLSRLKNHINVIIMTLNTPQIGNNPSYNLTNVAFPNIRRPSNSLSPIHPIFDDESPRRPLTMDDLTTNALSGTVSDSDDFSIILGPEAGNTSSFFDLTPSEESINFEPRQRRIRSTPPRQTPTLPRGVNRINMNPSTPYRRRPPTLPFPDIDNN